MHQLKTLSKRKQLLSAFSMLGLFIPNMGVANEEPLKLDETRIEGEKTQEISFKLDSASAATLTPASLDEIPLNIAVLPENLFDSLQISELRDALLLNGSVVRTGGHSQRFDTLFIRGFALDTNGNVGFLVNGVPVVSPDAPPVDISSLQRIEILKGAASLLYGAGEPAGVINYVYKDPLTTPQYHVETTIGSYDTYRAELDATGPLGSDDLAYRFTLGWEDSKGVVDFDYFKKITPTFQLNWTPTERTNVRFISEYIDVESNPINGDTIVLPTGEILELPKERYLGFSDDYEKQQHVALQLQVEQELTDSMTLLMQGGYNDGGREAGASGYYGFATLPFDPLTGNIGRHVFDQERTAESFYIGSHLLWEIETESMTHNLTLGGNYSEARVNNINGFSIFTSNPFIVGAGNAAPAVPPINIFNPVTVPYGHLTNFGDSPPFSNDLWQTNNYGINLQDMIDIPDWNLHVLLGLRYAYSELDILRDIDHAGNPAPSPLQAAPFQDTDGDAVLPRAGVVYDINDTTNVFFSYAESFKAPFSTAVDANGNPLTEPEKGVQYEAGIRKSWFDGKLSSTFAVYELTKENTIEATGIPGVSQQVGERRSRGVEVDIAGEPYQGWNFYFSYAYTDTEIVDAGSSNASEGNRFNVIPLHKLSLWNTFTLQSGRFEGLGVGYGIDHQSESNAGIQTAFKVPSRVIHNANIFYTTDTSAGELSLNLGFKNLTDKLYYQNTDAEIFLKRGDPFKVEFTAGLTF